MCVSFENKPVYETAYGSAYIGDSLELMQTLPDKSINLILTSPPFALTRKKEYGNKSAKEYVAWFMDFGKQFKRILKDDGSLVLDLGGAYLPGYPVRALYQYELLIKLCDELGFYLAQEFFHYNPSRLPAPAEWVNVRRIRVKDSVNVVWWLSVNQYPKANNRNVLKPYSKSMVQLLENGYKPNLRPSGHDISDNFSKDNNGAIPPNLLTFANTESNSVYLTKCKQANIKPHPARFPIDFPKFFINFLTDIDDVVFDPFAGSNTTGQAAEFLHRKWIAFELDKTYLDGSVFRFFDNLDVLKTEGKHNA